MIGIYHPNGKSFYVRYKSVIYSWLGECAKREGFVLGDISFVMCTHEEHIVINRRYLQHNYYTDVITFDDSNPDTNVIDGDIFIDYQTVQENARRFGVTYYNELHRVMVHGILHLCGQSDTIDVEATIMHKKEDRYLELYEEFLEQHKEKERKISRLVGYQARRENERRAKNNLPLLVKFSPSQQPKTERRHNRGNSVHNGKAQVVTKSRVLDKDEAKGEQISKEVTRPKFLGFGI